MLDPRISFKNRWLAGVLAFLVPGAGHLYQGRIFKGILCSVCILATFFFGLWLGDWGVVNWKRDPVNFLNPYYAQFFVGLPALPALVQSHRYESKDNYEDSTLESPIEGRLRGTIANEQRANGAAEGALDGVISLKPEEGSDRNVVGEFKGTLTKPGGGAEEVRYAMGGRVRLGKPVSADPNRTLEVEVADANTNPPRPLGRLHGAIPRRWLDRFEAPPDEDYNLALQRELGKFYELALTFTMIAGLLNILVILDAVEGPAYGYGDPESMGQAESNRSTAATGAPPDPKATPGGAAQPAKSSKIPSKT